jgi:hypothetical protein
VEPPHVRPHCFSRVIAELWFLPRARCS